MKNKRLIIIVGLVLLNLLIIGGTKTLSAYRSSKNATVSLDLAKIIFNNEEVTSLSLNLDDLVPGTTKEFLFQVKNFNDDDNSEITIGYTIGIETLRLIPFVINLYEGDTLLLTCDETSPRSSGVVTCTSEEYILDYNSNVSKNYKIEVSFPSDNNDDLWDTDYSDITDYVDVYINSYQKK